MGKWGHVPCLIASKGSMNDSEWFDSLQSCPGRFAANVTADISTFYVGSFYGHKSSDNSGKK